jgi:DNA-binding protein WhiA
LCGAFLARGSVNDPETSKYHFEITLEDAKNTTFVQHIMNDRDFNAKIIKRRNKLVVYLKEAEKIVDIIRFIGATNQAFAYEDLRIERDFNNSINRIINCEVANEQKTLSAANEQLKYIKYLEYNYPLEKIDPKILTVMKVRQDNPEASLMELLEILETEYGQKLSKPGLSHRFAKIKELAIEHNKKQR